MGYFYDIIYKIYKKQYCEVVWMYKMYNLIILCHGLVMYLVFLESIKVCGGSWMDYILVIPNK